MADEQKPNSDDASEEVSEDGRHRLPVYAGLVMLAGAVLNSRQKKLFEFRGRNAFSLGGGKFQLPKFGQQQQQALPAPTRTMRQRVIDDRGYYPDYQQELPPIRGQAAQHEEPPRYAEQPALQEPVGFAPAPDGGYADSGADPYAFDYTNDPFPEGY